MGSQKWQRIIDQQIEEAKAQGKFDNLPGQGKPLDLSENPFENPEMRTAYRLLANNGFALPWMEDRKEIETEWETAKNTLTRGWAWYEEAARQNNPPGWIHEEWRRIKTRFEAEVARLNTRISAYNVQAPSARFERLPINAAKFIEKTESQPPK